MVDIKEKPGTSENPYAAFMREGNLELLPTLQKIELMQLLEIFEVVEKWFNNQPSDSHKLLRITGGTMAELLPENLYFTRDGLCYGHGLSDGYQVIGIPAALALLDMANLEMKNVAMQLKEQIAEQGKDTTHAAEVLDSIIQLNGSYLKEYDLKGHYRDFYRDWCSIYCAKAEDAEKKNEPDVLDYYNRLIAQFSQEGGFEEYQFRTLAAERSLVAIISDSKKAG